MDREGILSVIEKQRKFFSTHRTRPAEFRLRMLKRLRKSILDHKDEVVRAVREDFGIEHPFDAYGRLVFVLDELNYFIKNLKRWMKPVRVNTSILLSFGKSRYEFEPMGVSLLIGAWNAPYLINLFTLIASIAAGNCVVLKPSEHSARSSRVLRDIVASAFPDE